LNDPVYVEAAQALARRMARNSGPLADEITYGFRLCLARPPHEGELHQLVQFYNQAHADFSNNPDDAERLATEPIGPVPAGTEVVALASLTAVGNVLLNLDEMLMKP